MISAVLTMLASFGADLSDRGETLARAVASSTESREEAAAVVALWWHESRFDARVHAGEKLGDGGRAICLGQLHRLPRQALADWLALGGLDDAATRRCAEATVTALRRARNVCRARHGRASWAAAYSLYGSGRSCTLPLGAQRERTMQRLLRAAQ